MAVNNNRIILNALDLCWNHHYFNYLISLAPKPVMVLPQEQNATLNCCGCNGLVVKALHTDNL